MLPEKCHPPHLPWSHTRSCLDGLDWPSVRRGKEVYEQVFAPCHSMKFLKFRHLEAFMSTAELKEMAAAFMVTDEDPDSEGNPKERKGKPNDPLPSPYKNKNEARYANAGALPPDLSLIVNAREGGCDYIYALMTSFGRPIPAGLKVGENQYYNPYFPGGLLGMPPPLNDDMIEYEDGTPASALQMAKDVTMFLQWSSEIHWDEHKLMGLKGAATALVALAAFAYHDRYIHAHIRARRVTFRALRYAAK
eukprot:NODE_3916_length_873_cov_217.013405_g3761_i0.p1 GENE.NODE_3916_length_873_cov_217.013405_g3761_i0~~NODE_3916_length_873_cov_217.013405_g3761_i0.p1  ORF type:complete len:266 (-),score=44.92 NODE_3916_length_873_cov_217.013405_g3761_i0:75-821(-)